MKRGPTLRGATGQQKQHRYKNQKKNHRVFCFHVFLTFCFSFEFPCFFFVFLFCFLFSFFPEGGDGLSVTKLCMFTVTRPPRSRQTLAAALRFGHLWPKPIFVFGQCWDYPDRPPKTALPRTALPRTTPPRLHTTAREFPTCTFRGPSASNTTKIPREDPKSENCGGRGNKKREILGTPIRAPHFGPDRPPERAANPENKWMVLVKHGLAKLGTGQILFGPKLVKQLGQTSFGNGNARCTRPRITVCPTPLLSDTQRGGGQRNPEDIHNDTSARRGSETKTSKEEHTEQGSDAQGSHGENTQKTLSDKTSMELAMGL